MGTEQFITENKIIEVRLLGEFVGFRIKDPVTKKEINEKVFSTSDVTYKPSLLKFVNEHANEHAEAIINLLKAKRKLS